LELVLRQNFIERHSFVNDTAKQSPHTDFSVSLSVNDSLVKYIRFGEIYLRQQHTGLFPQGSSLFSSWGFCFGTSLVTEPFMYDICLNAGVSFSYLDMNFNNRVDSEDGLFQLSLGISRTF
jgi:hypothetical protein